MKDSSMEKGSEEKDEVQPPFSDTKMSLLMPSFKTLCVVSGVQHSFSFK